MTPRTVHLAPRTSNPKPQTPNLTPRPRNPKPESSILSPEFPCPRNSPHLEPETSHLKPVMSKGHHQTKLQCSYPVDEQSHIPA
jgi:hypothetical protein